MLYLEAEYLEAADGRRKFVYCLRQSAVRFSEYRSLPIYYNFHATSQHKVFLWSGYAS